MAVDIVITSELLEGEDECVISNWLAGDGELVATGSLLLEIMVSKVVYEVYATADGTLRVKAETDEVVSAGDVVGTIE